MPILPPLHHEQYQLPGGSCLRVCAKKLEDRFGDMRAIAFGTKYYESKSITFSQAAEKRQDQVISDCHTAACSPGAELGS